MRRYGNDEQKLVSGQKLATLAPSKPHIATPTPYIVKPPPCLSSKVSLLNRQCAKNSSPLHSFWLTYLYLSTQYPAAHSPCLPCSKRELPRVGPVRPRQCQSPNMDENGFNEEPQKPRQLPDDLPKSLDDRRNTSNAFREETEVYDPWMGMHIP